MDVASLIAAQAMRVDGSAAMSACSRSREKVAMPHCRGGQVATNATESALAGAVIKLIHSSIQSRAKWLGVLGWLRSQSRTSAVRAVISARQVSAAP